MAIYRPRRADRRLDEMLRAFSAVLVVGPRATGKTTTAARRSAAEVRLGLPRVAAAVGVDPAAALADLPRPTLIDEWQLVPDVLAVVKEAVDQNPARGAFIVTGSVRGDLDSPTWPGTGRLVRLPMYGLTEREIGGDVIGPTWLERLEQGERFAGWSTDEDVASYVARALRSGFPEAVFEVPDTSRATWLASYVDQLLTRDAEGVDAGRDPERLRRYFAALALNSAGVVDDTTLWQAAQINRATARAYESLLRNLLVIDAVPAWTTNRLKRLTLVPKRYFVDAGLLAAAVGASTSDVRLDGDLLGRVLDTFVVAQLRAELALAEPIRRLSHLRTAEGRHEVDIVIELGPRRIAAIEIKATSTPDAGDAQHLRWLRRELGDGLAVGVLLHCGPRAFELDDGTLALPIASLWAPSS